jgi:peptidoglycan/LPS O-acetylase OafA/YrhL
LGAVEGRIDLLNLCAALVGLVSTWALAEISFRYLETPFLNLKKRFVSVEQTRTPNPTGEAV